MQSTFFRFFGLSANPFNDSHDPSYLFLNHKIQTILDDMVRTIQARKGLILLTGEAGTGKTTVINKLMQLLRMQQTPTAFIFNPHLKINELVDLILANFGMATEPQSLEEPLVSLNQWSTERCRRGINTVIIFDEAQGLSAHLLNKIGTLVESEASDQCPLQIVFSGQPKLAEMFQRSDLHRMHQGMGLRCQTMPLTREEAHGYIHHRLRVAGGVGREVFVSEAIDRAHYYSDGIPRVMNQFCEHAMLRAFLTQTQPIPSRMMDEIKNDSEYREMTIANRVQSVRGGVVASPHEDLSPSGRYKLIFAEPTTEQWEGNLTLKPQSQRYIGRRPSQAEIACAMEGSSGHGTGAQKSVEDYRREPVEPSRIQWADLIHGPQVALAVETEAKTIHRVQRAGAKWPARSFTYLLDFSALYQALRKRRPFSQTFSADLRFVPRWASNACKMVFAETQSPAWKQRAQSVIIWLQQPFPAINSNPTRGRCLGERLGQLGPQQRRNDLDGSWWAAALLWLLQPYRFRHPKENPAAAYAPPRSIGPPPRCI